MPKRSCSDRQTDTPSCSRRRAFPSSAPARDDAGQAGRTEQLPLARCRHQIDWALKAEHRGLFDYIRQLIALRKAHPAFRIPTAEGLRQWLRFLDTGDSGVIAYTGRTRQRRCVERDTGGLQRQSPSAEFRIPEAERIVVCRDGRIDPDSRERLSGGRPHGPSSALIAYCE
ncbi:MAG: hypothetical protein ACLU5I_04645 [Alistipes finegoldii]